MATGKKQESSSAGTAPSGSAASSGSIGSPGRAGVQQTPAGAARASGGGSGNAAAPGESAPGGAGSLLPALSLPTGGGAVRGIGEKFTVNSATGTASLSIPLPASPGRGSQGPDVSLSYSSGAGNGAFGLGFDLSVPSVTRKTDKGLPRYGDAPNHETDVFVLSGAEDLVPVLDEDGLMAPISRGDFTAYRYRPRTEGFFARIERWVHTSSRDIHWRVTTKDNVTFVYGASDGARIADPSDATHVFSWLLEETRDDKGNVTKYEYKAEDGAGVDATKLSEKSRFHYGPAPSFRASAQRYLKRVLYGNSEPDVAADFLFEMVFDYGEHAPDALPTSVATPAEVNEWSVRVDPFSSYRSGFEVRTYRLCRRVLMFHRLAAPVGLVRPATLVRATEFTYEEGASFTYLTAATQVGYLEESGDWTRAEMPRLDLDYQRPEIHDELVALPEESLEGLVGGADGRRKQWIDLDGEGISGVLVDQDGGWFYKENRGGGELGAPRRLSTQPNVSSPTDGRQTLEDLDGDGRLELVTRQASLQGYFARTTEGGFEPLRSFETVPNVDWNDPNLRLIDLDGDGFGDILITDDQAFVWYRSRAKQGFESAKRVSVPFDENEGPRVVFSDAEQSVVLADMSGDGLVDIVRVRNGSLCYWPNLGYGHFGAKVSLENVPVFAAQDEFHASRVRLADVDGSGTSDVLYSGARETTLFFNESGNGLSAGRVLHALPPVDSATQLSVTDLLGTGTSCLVWSSPLRNASQNVFYVDVLGSKKPHLLTEVKNNLGAITRIEYASSTRFYLDDKKEGIAWLTRLPFPVQVVERMERTDAISGGKLVSRYKYRHGFFDGFEREFRGFARVEQLDAEDFAEPGSDPLLYQSPVKTISWFHTGAWLEKERLELALQSEYFPNSVDPSMLPPGTVIPPVVTVPDTILPSGLSTQDEREAARALRGSTLRTEVYAADGTPDEAYPYVITEQNQEVRVLQASRGENRSGIVFAFPRETVTVSSERKLDDARVGHELLLEVDAFGNVTKKAAIAYGRAGNGHPSEQKRAYATLTEASFVNHDEDADDWFRVGIEFEQKLFEVTGLEVPDVNEGLVDLDELRTTLSGLNPANDLAFEEEPTAGVERRLLDHKQQYFYDESLSSTPLGLGQITSLALPFETRQLALTAGQVSALVTESAALGGVTFVPSTLVDDGGYVLVSGDYWTKSGRVIFDDSQFYLPTEAIDAFGNQAFVEWDEFGLLVTEARDALQNTIVSTNDYRVLAPREIRDPNLNRTEVEFDALGMVVKTAVKGKVRSTDGDTLADPTMRLEYDLLAFQERGEPTFVHTYAREKHGSANTRFQESFTYSDGFGRVVMTKVQAEPDPLTSVARWVGTGRTVFNNKGNAVKQYEPFFSETSEYEDEAEIVETGVTPILRYDSIDRVVRTDLPDGTFTKVVFGSWSQTSFDQNDTVLESDWYSERGSPSATGGAPSDPDERAAWLSAQHADTPTVVHLDTLGRPFLSIAHNKTGTGSGRVEAFYRTRTELDIEGNTQRIYDARQHQTTSSNHDLKVGAYATITQRFDVLGRRLRVDSPDAGARLAVADAAGKPLRSWDARGQTMWSEYDALQRPTHAWVHDGSDEKLVLRTVYGEALADETSGPTPEDLNLRGRAHLVYDSAGAVKSEGHDFKGNLLRANRRLTTNYLATPDWIALSTDTLPSAIESAAAGLLSSEVWETETEYDALNRVVKSTTPDGSETRPVYNEANLLEELHVDVRGNGEQVVVDNLDYNARGQRILCEHADPTNGSVSHRLAYTYDEKTFRLTRLLTTRTSDSVVLQDLRYFFDAVGNISEVQDLADVQTANGVIFSGTAPESATGYYEYDALYRLTRAFGREHPGQQPDQVDPVRGNVPHANDLPSLERYREDFVYDEVGNIEELAHMSPSTNWTRTYQNSTTSNRLLATNLPNGAPGTLTYSYDAHGSMTNMGTLGDLSWDYADRLRHVDKVGGGDVYFTYDAGGQRVRKVWEHSSLIEERVYLGGFEIYRKWDGPIGDPGTTLELERETLHINDGQRRIAMVETKTVDPSGTGTGPLNTPRWRFQLTNHLDSASMELDHEAGVISYEEYHPYGSTAFHTAKAGAEVSAKRYRYTGKERDDETGLYYHGARYYAAWLGRWTAADPAGLIDGLNLYRYSRDNPINYSDPGGTRSKTGLSEDGETYTNEQGVEFSWSTREEGLELSEDIVFPDDPLKVERKQQPKVKPQKPKPDDSKPPEWLEEYVKTLPDNSDSGGEQVEEIAKAEAPTQDGSDKALSFAKGFAKGAATSAAIGVGLGLLSAPVAGVVGLGLLGYAAYSLINGGGKRIVETGSRIAAGDGSPSDFEAAGNLLGGFVGGRVKAPKASQGGGGGASSSGSGSSASGSSGPSRASLVSLLRARALKQAGFADEGAPIILDENLAARGVAEALRKAGFNVRTVAEIFGKNGVKDPVIREFAEAVGARVLTMDRGRQVGEGFGQLAIQVPARVGPHIESLVRILNGG